jgi:hypothetical protein
MIAPGFSAFLLFRHLLFATAKSTETTTVQVKGLFFVVVFDTNSFQLLTHPLQEVAHALLSLAPTWCLLPVPPICAKSLFPARRQPPQ